MTTTTLAAYGRRIVEQARRLGIHPNTIQRWRIWDDCWGVSPAISRVCGTFRERRKGFPTQLPLALLLPIVGCASDPDDLIIDPFSGSGTTGEVAIKLFAALPRYREISPVRKAFTAAPYRHEAVERECQQLGT
jgi:hypothetical protein